MANNYESIHAIANSNNMGLSNTIKRDYGIPLDYSSVQESYEAALNYAKNSTLAYIGQPIAVGDTLYIVTDESAGYLKAVGTKPIGDESSISITDDGLISIKGFSAADGLTLPHKNSAGAIEWVPISSLVTNEDNNTKTTILTEENSAIDIICNYDNITDTYTYTLDVTLPEYTIKKTSDTANKQVKYNFQKNGSDVADCEIIVPDAYDDSSVVSRIAAVETNLNNKVEQSTLDTNYYNKTIIDGKLDAITGASGDTAGSVAADLLGYKSTNDARVSAIEASVGAINSELDTFVTEADVDKKIEAIDNSSIISAIEDEASRASSKESELSNQIQTNISSIASNTTKIADIAAKIATYDADILPVVQANQGAITVLQSDENTEGSVRKIVKEAINNISVADIPIATAFAAGLVKASADVQVAEDGTMMIGTISTDKLTGTISTDMLSQGTAALVLSGGSGVDTDIKLN